MKRWTVGIAVLVGAFAFGGAARANVMLLDVPSDGSHVQSQALLLGVQYTVEASGDWYHHWPAQADMTDAAWTTFPNPPVWTEANTLAVDGQKIPWLGTTDGTNFYAHTFSPTHVYRHYVTGSGQPLDFCIWDSYYPDNHGSLQVTISNSGANAAPSPAPSPCSWASVAWG